MKKFIFALCAGALVLTGCSTYQYSARQTNINRQDIQATPSVVDVRTDFTKRIEVTSGWHAIKDDAMNECRYIAITQNKIDLVVDPIFKIEYRPMAISNKFKATLIGFAGYYTNSRTQKEDLEVISQFSREDIEKYLILHNPAVLNYMNNREQVVNIYHNEGQKACDKPAEEPKAAEPKAAKGKK